MEPQHLHFVDHIDERLRWTTWTVQRDRALESLIVDKVLAARRYYRQVLNEFDRTHGGKVPDVAQPIKELASPQPTTPPVALPESIF